MISEELIASILNLLFDIISIFFPFRNDKNLYCRFYFKEILFRNTSISTNIILYLNGDFPKEMVNIIFGYEAVMLQLN
jgi:hypothetical protein